MDALKLQKINQLASELRKHNFAASSEDAYKQAEGVYDESEGAVVTIREEEPAVRTVHMQQTDDLTSRKIELLIEMHNKKYEEEFSVLRNAINQLIGELNSVKAQVAARALDETPRHKEKQAELKPEVKEDHPRQGKFQPSDVDIQKMFYFGSKR
ncbi:hypothetical protein C4580_03540 [Candidatus Woesearchaeota archaeon]|nr:MAG: hypothetical protein C4580_03540 [Candidatus Woesearchaeota archaeon]